MADKKEEIVKLIKSDLNYFSEDGFAVNLGYKLLDDGTLAVQLYDDDGKVENTYMVNISIGRELEPSEWKEP